jgi:hypothetical protein
VRVGFSVWYWRVIMDDEVNFDQTRQWPSP